MKVVHAWRHVPFEDLGTLAPCLEAHGYTIRYLEVGLPGWEAASQEDPDLLVVLGGPIGVYEEGAYPFLRPEIAQIKCRLDAHRPTLGICLGAQLMARALGATVAPTGIKEIGFSPLLLSEAGRNSALAALKGIHVMHWHGDEAAVPVTGTLLASTAPCHNQAFAVGTHALALQFHLELDQGAFESWLIGHAVELSVAKIDPRALRASASRHALSLAQAAARVLDAWLPAAERAAGQHSR